MYWLIVKLSAELFTLTARDQWVTKGKIAVNIIIKEIQGKVILVWVNTRFEFNSQRSIYQEAAVVNGITEQ